jgi:hypothetical protein
MGPSKGAFRNPYAMQRLLCHVDVSITMIYTHVFNRGGRRFFASMQPRHSYIHVQQGSEKSVGFGDVTKWCTQGVAPYSWKLGFR